MRDSDDPNKIIHVAGARCAVKNSTEPHGTAAGTAQDLQKPHGILQSEMVEAPRNRPEPRMEPCGFAGSLNEYWQFCLSGLLLIKILKIKKAGTEFEALAAEGRAVRGVLPLLEF